jgi:methylphosphotriester-DNA--protein-cysteine methyltransferase
VASIQSGLATAAALATVDGIADSILEDTGTTVPAQIAALNNLSSAQAQTAAAAALTNDPKAFRNVFSRITGISPLAYRNRYNKEH